MFIGTAFIVMIVRGAIKPLQIFAINKEITQTVSNNLICTNINLHKAILSNQTMYP